MARESAKNSGVFGSIAAPFLQLHNCRADNPCNLDLEVCGRLIQEISS